MPKNTEASPRTFRKRYITIAALSALTITGGAIGATVTAESTIAGNKITITQHVNTPASITASGNSMKVQFKQGEAPELADIDVSTNTVGAVKITLTNTGETDAVVKGVKVEDLSIPTVGMFSDDYVGLYIENKDKRLLRQLIAKGENPGVGDTTGEIIVPAKSSVDVWAYLWGKFGKSSFTFLDTYEKTFSIAFDYTDKK